MTNQDMDPDGGDVLTLQELIRARMDERGWSYSYLERCGDPRTGVGLTKSRWQQLGTGKRMTEFPEPATLQHIADVLEVDITIVLLATGKSLQLPVRSRGSNFGNLLPAGADQLSERMREGLLAIIRAAVAERLANQDEKAPPSNLDITLEWPHTRPSHLHHGSA